MGLLPDNPILPRILPFPFVNIPSPISAKEKTRIEVEGEAVHETVVTVQLEYIHILF
jgi:hypothetical protein